MQTFFLFLKKKSDDKLFLIVVFLTQYSMFLFYLNYL